MSVIYHLRRTRVLIKTERRIRTKRAGNFGGSPQRAREKVPTVKKKKYYTQVMGKTDPKRMCMAEYAQTVNISKSVFHYSLNCINNDLMTTFFFFF